jgi:hypothetical protein
MREAALFLFLPLSAFGQAQSFEYSIRGIVRNTVSKDPVGKALVVLERVPAYYPDRRDGDPEVPQTKATLSGAGGEFTFDGLPAGNYTCEVYKPDLMAADPEDPGIQRSATIVVPRPPADGLVQLNLTPFGGAIRGKLVNQFGEPLENFMVVIYSLSNWDGERTMSELCRTWTDDLGAFLVTRVPSGKYYVKAVGRRGGTETHVGPDEMQYAPWESFLPVYFGQASELASAVPIQVSPGSIVRADFQLELQPAFRIHGILKRYLASETVTFELLQGSEPGEPHRAVLDAATGQFDILDVLPGTYTLRATQGKTRGEASVTVSGTDLGGVSISLLPALTVNGSVHSVGVGRGAPAPSRVHTRREAGCSVNLREHRRLDSEFSGSAENGQFSIEGVFPGEYRAVIQCQGGYPVSATFGDADLLTNPIITLSSGAPPPVEIAFKPGGGTLNARFAERISSRAAVLLVPSFSATAGPVLESVFPALSANAAGVTFSNLVPGDYLVYGLSHFEDAEFRNAAFLQSLSGGTPVRIEDGKTAEVTIAGVSK